VHPVLRARLGNATEIHPARSHFTGNLLHADALDEKTQRDGVLSAVGAVMDTQCWTDLALMNPSPLTSASVFAARFSIRQAAACGVSYSGGGPSKTTFGASFCGPLMLS
jgi:hypothetical protein